MTNKGSLFELVTSYLSRPLVGDWLSDKQYVLNDRLVNIIKYSIQIWWHGQKVSSKLQTDIFKRHSIVS